jgi:hypothetical protein
MRQGPKAFVEREERNSVESVQHRHHYPQQLIIDMYEINNFAG